MTKTNTPADSCCEKATPGAVCNECAEASAAYSAAMAAPQANTKATGALRDLSDLERKDLIGSYFADDWAREAAAGLLHDYAAAIAAFPAFPAAAAPQAGVQPFQQCVQPWMLACFGAEIAADRAERNHRFLEEALELVQACGCTASEAHQLVDYVFGREIGEPDQEAGGVMITLAALCLANGLDMHAAGETELARIWTKVDAIRAKQAAKPKHSPLPAPAPVAPGTWYECCMDGSRCRGCDRRGSALPLAAQPAAQPADAQDVARWKRDSELLGAVESGCWDVRFASSANGDAGDSSITIEVVQHFMAAPRERVIGENYQENLRAALEQALTAAANPPSRPEYDDAARTQGGAA